MKLLLVVGTANDIFIYNYAKWLKASINVSIDVFEFYPSKKQGYGNEFYDRVFSAKGCKIPKIRGLVDPYIKAYQLNSFIKYNQYDIIHCHWVVSPLVISRGLKSHCRKLLVTFWGKEYDNMYLLQSNKLYRKHLDIFMKDVDAIINSQASEQLLKNLLHTFTGIFYNGSLGSAPLEVLYSLCKEETKNASKIIWGIPEGKLNTLIGYSGKSLHQHVTIIEELTKHKELKEKLHLFAPMTRGADDKYIYQVNKLLEKSGYSYTLISGRFLTDQEIAQIRNATDITLQLSSSDGFSRSIIECLCAKSVVIYGAWLGYEKHLQASGFKAISVNSISDGIDLISSIIDHLGDYNDMVEANYKLGKKQYLWAECIKDWVNAYNDLLK